MHRYIKCFISQKQGKRKICYSVSFILMKEKVLVMSSVKCFMNFAEIIEDGDGCEIFSCLFGLKPIHVNIYFYLLKGEYTIKEVANHVGRDRTTTIRLMKNLIDQGLVEVEEIQLMRGSSKKIYKAIEQTYLKERLLLALDEISDAVKVLVSKNWAEMPLGSTTE